MALEEPTTSELIRRMADQLTRMEAAMVTFVTREHMDLRLGHAEQRITDLEESKRHDRRSLWTAGIAPVIVGVILFVLQGVAK